MIKNNFSFFFLVFFTTLLHYDFSFAEENSMRARQLYSQVRCPTCQGQSIEDTNTEHAKMLREYIDEQIAQKKSDEEILDSIRQGYGEFIVLKPKISKHTFMLWLVPFLLGLCLLLKFRNKTKIHDKHLSN